ncbi:MAG TPA: YciI family protein [Burkholderiales bacterium]|nr:YciI family protein [Burkholderiales bacterium]
MKYLALCYYDTAAFEKLPAPEAEKIGPACKPHDANLKATGKLVIQGSLADPGKWFHFVPKDGKPQHRDGAYAEGTRQAGAFFIFEAADPEQARRIASKHAAANFGEHLGFAVEVRPCAMFEKY